ncbi:MAG: pitrilysin family protein [Cyanobacteria bacterium P01_E01_bin.34]
MKLPIHHIRLENGVRVLAISTPDVDIVAAHIFWLGGVSVTHTHQAGLAHLTAAVLTKGTKNLSAQQIAESVESMGALLGAECAPDYCGLALKSVSSDFPTILQLASEIVRYPTFPDVEVERERCLILQAIRSQQERSFTAAFAPLRKALYGEHPYARSIAGTAESVAMLSRQDVIQFHRDYFRPDTTVIAICGRLSLAEIEHRVGECFGNWATPDNSSTVAFPNSSALPVLRGKHRLNIAQDAQQAIAIVGYRAPSIYSPDWEALKLLAVHLGGGLSSRLFVQLREKQGLAYDVSASYSSRRHEAPFIAQIGTAPANTELAIAGLQAEIERLRDQPLTEEELTLAKRKILGHYALSKQTNGQVAQLMGWYETLGLGVDRDRRYPDIIQALSAEVLQRAAQEHLCNPIVSVVSP